MVRFYISLAEVYIIGFALLLTHIRIYITQIEGSRTSPEIVDEYQGYRVMKERVPVSTLRRHTAARMTGPPFS